MKCSSMVEQSAVNRWVVGSNPTTSANFINNSMKIIIFLIGSFILFSVSGCYSTKSMGDSEKADKYLIVY